MIPSAKIHAALIAISYIIKTKIVSLFDILIQAHCSYYAVICLVKFVDKHLAYPT